MIGVATTVVSCVQIYIASKQREQDLLIASRNREQDLQISNNARWGTMFAEYMKEVSQVSLAKNSSSNESNALIRDTIRAKTLNALRQLGPKHVGYLIRYLYDLGILSVRTNPINLEYFTLDGMDISVSQWSQYRMLKLDELCLSKVSLTRASFAGASLTDASFSRSDLTEANFHLADLDKAVFFLTSVQKASFTDADCFYTEFLMSDLRGANINDKQLGQARSTLFSYLPNGTISRRPSLITNGDAEIEKHCFNHTSSIEEGTWTVTPQNGVGIIATTTISSLQMIYEWMLSLKRRFKTDFQYSILLSVLFTFGKCSFIVPKYQKVSMKRSFDVPLEIQRDRKDHDWMITAFCVLPFNDFKYQWLMLNFTEYDSNNTQVANKRNVFTNYENRILMNFPKHPNSIRASILLTFNFALIGGNDTSTTNDKAMAVCDNFYVSIEARAKTYII